MFFSLAKVINLFKEKSRTLSPAITRTSSEILDVPKVSTLTETGVATPIAYATLYLLFGIANKIPPMF